MHELTRKKTLEEVARAIKQNGGSAVVNTDTTLQGAKIIDAAVSNFGRVHILINAAAAPKQARKFDQISDAEWSSATQTYIKGSFVVSSP